MKNPVHRILILPALLIVACTALSQAPVRTEYQFNDDAGNTFSIRGINKLPAPLDTAFLRQCLNASDFLPTKHEPLYRYFYVIKEIKVIKKKSAFELTVMATPKTNDVAVILKTHGNAHYKLKINKRKKDSKGATIEYLFAEI